MNNTNPFMRHYPLLTELQKKAFAILEPYFFNNILAKDYNAQGILIDRNTPHAKGGTWLCNYNLTPIEATIVVDTIREMNCAAACIFIFLYPSIHAFNTITQGNKAMLAVEAAVRNPKECALPPYFAVHSSASSSSCISLYKEIALQNMASNIDFMNTTAGRLPQDIMSDSASFIKRMMNKE